MAKGFAYTNGCPSLNIITDAPRTCDMEGVTQYIYIRSQTRFRYNSIHGVVNK